MREDLERRKNIAMIIPQLGFLLGTAIIVAVVTRMNYRNLKQQNTNEIKITEVEVAEVLDPEKK